ncbi:hypothetical protein [Microcoleus sp. bin38.metabat.b11b12b14.051]|uniref:hypothetical protein n=1 Tax=Microcoleus sp. bin38.metabat.b11b12b14.051 TaxID=2742709 RepID=UPI0025F4E193|nr:hypothetical protein [Microcoleus sp. bin38.metabat.b11b12b14.051]
MLKYPLAVIEKAMLSSQNLVEQVNDSDFIELWVDPIVFPPRILMLMGDKNSNCGIYEPSPNYQLLFLGSSYDEAHSWLLEDEYERVDGRLLASEIV